jgi:hypothetical protein
MAPKRQPDFHPQLPVQIAKPETHLDAELTATPQESPPAEAIQSVLEVAMRLGSAMRQPPLVLLWENLQGKAIQSVWKLATLETAKRRPQELGLPRTAGRLPPARPQELQLPLVADFPVPSARGRPHSQGPGPCAFFQETLVVRKCNRAVRCDGRPIFARYRPLNNRRALAGCDNKHSRSQRKHARPARTFPIAALDTYRCRPRRIGD